MSCIVDTIRSFEGLLSLGRAVPSDIEKAEKELSVIFAAEYKEYTLTFGAIEFGGKEFTGLVQPAYLNVVFATKSAREITPSAKCEWYVVMDPHFEGIIVWQDKEGFIYQTEPGKEPKKICNNLEEYMKKEYDARLL